MFTGNAGAWTKSSNKDLDSAHDLVLKPRQFLSDRTAKDIDNL